MDENGAGGTKFTGIRQIVRLKEILQKLHSVTLTQKPANSPTGTPPTVNNRELDDAKWSYDSDEETWHNPELPHDVPKGYLAVYVGYQDQELRRFIVPTSYLRHHLFKVLLGKAEEEFGFDHRGGLTIPCDVETFKYLLKCMENHAREGSS